MTHCLARRQSDQMCCHKCGLLWDITDPEPPTCPKEGNKMSGFFDLPKRNNVLIRNITFRPIYTFHPVRGIHMFVPAVRKNKPHLAIVW